MSEPHDQPDSPDDGASLRESSEHREQIERDQAAQSDARQMELTRIAAEREELKRILTIESQQRAIEDAKQGTQQQNQLAEKLAAQIAQEAHLEALARERSESEQAEQAALAARIEAERRLSLQIQARLAQEQEERDLVAQRAAKEEELERATAERVAQERALQRITVDGVVREETLKPVSADREARAGNRQVELSESRAAGEFASRVPMKGAGAAAPLSAAGHGKSIRRVYGVAAALAVVVGLYLAIGAWFTGEKPPGQPSAQARSPLTAPPPEPALPTAGTPTPVPPTVTAALPPAVQKEVAVQSDQGAESKMREHIQQWADAWSRKDVATYLASYAKEFEIPGGLSRADWEAQRKSRLGKYRTITVKLREVRVSLAGDVGQAEFIQDFQTESFREVGVKKKLGLRNVDGRWLIVSEKES